MRVIGFPIVYVRVIRGVWVAWGLNCTYTQAGQCHPQDSRYHVSKTRGEDHFLNQGRGNMTTVCFVWTIISFTFPYCETSTPCFAIQKHIGRFNESNKLAIFPQSHQ